MSRYRFTIDVTIDDAALDEHDGDANPPPNDVDEWYVTDLITAIDLGIAEVDHAEPVDLERLGEEGE